ncbi:hypothetical protein NBRC116493_22210 [Aurantivibrio infirmus]
MGTETVIEAGNQCLEERTEIPGAPLWHMGKTARFESKESFDLLQNTVDYLTCKAQAKLPFTANEKEFMKELYEALWWGGHYHGFHEAAQLANHYVNGNGSSVKLAPALYTESVIVADLITAIKKHIALKKSKHLPFNHIKTGDPDFLNATHVALLKKGKRNVQQQGYLLPEGALLVEQSNLRLKNADHRFHISVNTTFSNKQFFSNWSIASYYDFESFDVSKDFITDIPLNGKFILKLPDGLSHYLTKIGVAQEFSYGTTWTEIWV